MNDLISRSRLLNEMSDWQYGEAPFLTTDFALEYTAKEMQTMIYRTIKDAMLCVADQPAVDAVPVVRCKDCRWSRGFATFACPMVGRVNLKDDDFCSRGERRTDETD